MPIALTWHENKTIYLSVRKKRNLLCLRVHRLFYNAPTPVLEALIRYALGKDKEAKAVIRQMAHLHFSRNRREAKALSTQGKAYDLKEIFTRMQKLLPIQDVSIGWSDRLILGRFKSITFGTFDYYTRQIRINPILDDEEVPLYFLEYIVYHEMLHAVCPSQMDVNGRCSIHTREFREKERQFPLFQEAKSWEKKSLMVLRKRSSNGWA